MTFQGFTPATFAFLAGLEATNTRDWFEAHRADYQAHWLTPGLDLAAALSGPVADLGLMAVPKLNASLRRLNRDTRFSADKRPYHARLHLILSTGPAFNKDPGVHLVLGPTGLGYGVGQWAFDPPALDRLRQAFCDADQRAGFLAALALAERRGARLDRPELARLPKGWQAAPEWEHLLRLKHVVVRTPEPGAALPDWLFTDQAVPRLVDLVAGLATMARWLKTVF